MKNTPLLLLAALLCFAYALRVTGTESSVIFSHDPQLVRQSMAVGQSLLNSNEYSTGFEAGFKYPLTLTYFLTGLYGLFFLVGRAIGEFETAIAFQDYVFMHRAFIYSLAVYGLNLIAVTLIPVIFFAQRSLNASHKGWLAVCLAATNLLLVQFAHQPRPHVPFATIAFIATVLLTLVACRIGGRKLFYISSIASALTVGTLQSGLLIGMPVVLMLYLRPYAESKYLWKELFSFHTIAFILIFISLSLALYPGLAGEVTAFAANFVNRGASTVQFGNDTHAFSTSMLSPAYIPQFMDRVKSYHPILAPALPIALVYFVWAFRRRVKFLLVALSFPLLNLFVWSHFQGTFPRITAVLTPFMIFVYAFVVEDLIQIIMLKRVLPEHLRIALVILLVLPSLACSIRLVYVMSQKDTRTMATEWVNENLPEGSSILLNFQLLTLLPTQSAILRQQSHFPETVGTYWNWLSDQADSLDTAPSFDIYNKQYWYSRADSAVPSVFLANADIRYILVQSYVSNPNDDTMIAYAQENGRKIKEFCPAFAVPVAELPEDMFYFAWRQIWQLQRPGPFIALYDLHQPPALPALVQFCESLE